MNKAPKYINENGIEILPVDIFTMPAKHFYFIHKKYYQILMTFINKIFKYYRVYPMRKVILSLMLPLMALRCFGAEYHVAISGADTNPGTAAQPFRTIQHGAHIAQPGDIITVHAGIYRERIDPPRGGTSDTQRITFQAAPGEKVEIRGSEPWSTWELVEGDVWKATIPNARFGAFNPFADSISGDWFGNKKRTHHTGAIYADGDWLAEAATQADLFKKSTTPWKWWFAQVEDSNTTVWAQFPGMDPNTHLIEVNARQTVFYPSKRGINYLTVRGFALRHGASPWAPPTAEQMGIIGTHWSKGWIIENNEISHVQCVGVALGKYGDEFDNKSADTAEGYVATITRALANGWNKDTIGHHVVRNNHIHHCEQAGIVGSLGPAFSRIIGNTIHDIHVRKLFGGAEMAAIKFHGAVDTEIRGNHIYNSDIGLWLDWMAQGTRVTANLFHDNRQDLFAEVNHGPVLVDNNIFLSKDALANSSHGLAFVHNLFAGLTHINQFDSRVTPILIPHGTAVQGLRDNPKGDDRYINNIFIAPAAISRYDVVSLPVLLDGNVYFVGAQPSAREAGPTICNTDPALALLVDAGKRRLRLTLPPHWAGNSQRQPVTTARLGTTLVSQMAFENPDGSPLRVDRDFFGKPIDVANPTPGPFADPGVGTIEISL